jgi:hypothetical protein
MSRVNARHVELGGERRAGDAGGIFPLLLSTYPADFFQQARDKALRLPGRAELLFCPDFWAAQQRRPTRKDVKNSVPRLLPSVSL